MLYELFFGVFDMDSFYKRLYEIEFISFLFNSLSD